MLPVVLSPYELHARSLCASAALLLGEPAVTLLPAPFEGTEAGDVGRAMMDSPGFERMMERWRWSSAMWHAGSLRAGVGGEMPVDYVRRAAASIVSGADGVPGGGGPLGRLVRETRFDETGPYLDAISRDLDRGGGDPSVSVPVSVGLESYSCAVGGLMAMSDGRSLVGRLEAHRERIAGRFTTALVHGGAGVLMEELREELWEELAGLRDCLDRVRRGVVDDRELESAADALAAGVRAVPDAALGPREEDERRVRGGVRRVAVSVTLAFVPQGDALRAATRAAEMLASGHGVRGRRVVRSAGDAGRSRDDRGSGQSTVARGEAPDDRVGLATGSVLRLRVRELPFGV